MEEFFHFVLDKLLDKWSAIPYPTRHHLELSKTNRVMSNHLTIHLYPSKESP